MSEPRPSRPEGVRPLPLREIALLTLAMALVSAVSFGFGYVTGRDQVAFVHDHGEPRGIDAELADEDLVELLSRIEVSNAADKGLGELTYPDELRGRPQERAPAIGSGWAIALGEVPDRRVPDLLTVLRNRFVEAYALPSEDGRTQVFVGSYDSTAEATALLGLAKQATDGLGLDAPKVVRDPRDAVASAEE